MIMYACILYTACDDPTWDFSSPESLPSGSAARFATSSRPFRWCDDQGRAPWPWRPWRPRVKSYFGNPGNRKLMVNSG